MIGRQLYSGLLRRRCAPARHSDNLANITSGATAVSLLGSGRLLNQRRTSDVTDMRSRTSSSGSIDQDGTPVSRRLLPAAVEKAQALLADSYKSATLDVHDGMMEDGVEPTVANIQVAIVVLSCSDLLSEFETQGFDSGNDMWRVEHVFTRAASEVENVSMDSLFDSIPQVVQEQGRTYRVFAISSAGCGKTTLFTKIIPLRWGMKELWSGMFDLVVARELRYEDVRLAKGVRELLGLNALKMTEEERQAVEDYVHDNSQRVCLVLDGLDETRLSHCSQFISDVINGKALKGIRLIITSRPCGDIFNLMEDKQHDRRVELIGFRPSDVETYINKILNAQDAEQLLMKVRNYPQVTSMMSTPVLAYEICKSFHLRKEVPMCVNDLFQMLILRLAERNSEGRRYRSWNDVPNHIQAPILKLGKFAFKNLIDQRLVFTEKELLNESILRDALEMGFLVACDRFSADHEKQYRFSHLTLQESLASLYVFFTGTMTSRKIVQLVESIGPDAGHVRTFWTLLAARLNSECLETLVNSLMTRKICEEVHPTCDVVVEEKEAKFPLNLHPVLCERLPASKHEPLANLLLNGIASSDGAQYVRSKMSLNKEPSHSAFLKTLLETWVAEIPIPNPIIFLSALSHLDMSTSRYCEDLIENQSSTEMPVHSLPLLDVAGHTERRSFRTQRMLAFRCFAEYAQHHNDRVQSVQSISASLEHEHGDVIVYGDGNPLECRSIETVVRHHKSSVKKVYLSGCRPSSVCQVTRSLYEATNVSTLVMAHCSPVSLVCNALQSFSSCLTNLYIRNIDVSDEDAAVLSSAIASCNKLEKLTMHRIATSSQSLCYIARSLSSLPMLKSVTFRHVEVLGSSEALEVLFRNLATCSLLEQLVLTGCGISSVCISLLACRLHYWPGLTVLNLQRNNLSDLTEDQAMEFIQAVNVHGGIQRLLVGSALLQNASYTHEITARGWC